MMKRRRSTGTVTPRCETADTSPATATATIEHGRTIVLTLDIPLSDVTANDTRDEDGVKYYLAHTKGMQEYVTEMPFRHEGDTKIHDIDREAMNVSAGGV